MRAAQVISAADSRKLTSTRAMANSVEAAPCQPQISSADQHQHRGGEGALLGEVAWRGRCSGAGPSKRVVKALGGARSSVRSGAVGQRRFVLDASSAS